MPKPDRAVRLFCRVTIESMKTWIEYLKSGLARKAPEDRIAGGKTYAGIGENLRRHKPFFRRHWKKGALGAGFILLNALMAFPMPLVSRFVIDDVILGKQLSLLPWVLLLMAAIALFSRAMGLFQNWFFLRYSQELTLDIQKQVLDHSFSLPKSFFDKNQTGYLLARMTGDIGGVTWFLSGSLVGIVTNILYFIGGIVLLFWLEWRLALAALAAVPVFLIVLRRFSDRMHALNHAGSEENARYMSGFQETLNSIPLVKAFAAEEKAVGKIMAGLRQVFRLSAERSVVGSVTGLALSSTPSLVNFCVFAIGAYWVITGHWSLGSLFAFQAYLGRVFGPAQSLTSTGLQMQNIRASLERITALLDVVPEEKAGEGEKVEMLEGGIEFRNVSFEYDPKNPVLSEVSFRVSSGEHIAVVGPSGVGKTTLLSLLLRFYNPTGGEILYDRKPARDYEVRSLRQRIGYVSQSPILLSGTVLENLRYGNPDATKNGSHARRKRSGHSRVHREPARRVRERGGREGRQPLGRPEAATCHRQGTGEEPRHPHPRRAHGGPGRPDREVDLRGTAPRDPGKDVLRGGPSPLDCCRLRPDPAAERKPPCGRGNARGTSPDKRILPRTGGLPAHPRGKKRERQSDSV